MNTRELITPVPPSAGVANVLLDQRVRYVAYRFPDTEIYFIIDLAYPVNYIQPHKPKHPYEIVCEAYEERHVLKLLNVLNCDHRVGKE